MPAIALDESIIAVADANGIATGQNGPARFGHSWHVARMTTTTDDFVNRNECVVYLNAATPDRVIGGSYNGNRDTDADPFTLQTLDKLIAVWTGCVPGTNCVLQIIGTIEDGRL
jgi:hypothetical protein